MKRFLVVLTSILLFSTTPSAKIFAHDMDYDEVDSNGTNESFDEEIENASDNDPLEEFRYESEENNTEQYLNDHEESDFLENHIEESWDKNGAGIEKENIADSALDVQNSSEKTDISSTDGIAYTVLTEDGNLIFFRSFEEYEDGYSNSVEDIRGNLYDGIICKIKYDSYTGVTTFFQGDISNVFHVFVADEQAIIAPSSSMKNWFRSWGNLISFDSNGFGVGGVTDFTGMFSDCISLKEVDLSGFHPNYIAQQAGMFSNCKSLEYLDMNGMLSANNIRGIFNGCKKLKKLDLSNCSIISSDSSIFYGCVSLNEVVLGPIEQWQWNNTLLPEGNWRNESLGIVKTEKELQEQFPSHYNEWAGTWKREISSDTGTSNAVFTDDGDLIFFRSILSYTSGARTTAIDIFGNEYTGTVFADLDYYYNSYNVAPWNGFNELTENTKRIYVAENQIIRPIYTANWFNGFSNLVSFDQEGFDTSKIGAWNYGGMGGMFRDCKSLVSLNLSEFTTSNVSRMENMFSGCSSLERLDLSNFDTSGILLSQSEKMMNMFSDCESLREIVLGRHFTYWDENALLPEGEWQNRELGIGKTESELQQEYPSHTSEWAGTWIMDVSSAGSPFAVMNDRGDLLFIRSFINPYEDLYESGEYGTIKDVYGNEYSGVIFVVREDGPLYRDKKEQIKTVSVAKNQVIHPTSMSYWFYGLSNLISFDSEGFETSNVISMMGTFNGCANLTELDLSNFDTSNVTNMAQMFLGCSSLKTIDLEKFVTSNVTNMSDMFCACSSLVSLDLSMFDTSNVTNMCSMFAECTSLDSVNLINFDTSSVEFMSAMFSECYSLTSLDLSSFTRITDPAGMFGNCVSLTTLDLSNFDMSKATDMRYMFSECRSLMSVKLGNKWTKWIDEAYLPEGIWSNGTVRKTEIELYNEYPAHSQEWSGLWTKDDPLSYGDIIPEDRPASPNLIPSGLWTSSLSDLPYTGKAITQDFRVYDNKTLLSEGTHYTVKYTNNTKVGTVTINITGKDNYVGTLKRTFRIIPLDISSASIALNKDVFAYTGKAIKPSVSSVLYNGTKLRANTDYSLSYYDGSHNIVNNPILADNYFIRITGKGNYDPSTYIELPFRIVSKTIIPTNALTITLSYTKIAYDGKEKRPAVVIKKGKEVLDNQLFTFEYFDNVDAGTATVEIASNSDDYAGTVRKTFTITGTALSKTKITGVDISYPYSGEVIKPLPVLTYNNEQLILGEDYEIIEYLDNEEIGTATIVLKGRGRYTGTVRKTFKITGKTFNSKTIGILSGFETSRTYTGEDIELDGVQLYDVSLGERIYKDIHYVVTYKNNLKVGTATMTFKGIKGYAGSFSKTFKITGQSLTDTEKISIEEIQDQPFTKDGVKPVPVVLFNGTQLEPNKDYTLAYKNNTIINDNKNPKKITSVTIKGKGNFTGSVTKEFIIVSQDIANVNIIVPDKIYSNKANAYKSTPVLTDTNGKKLFAGTDYDKNYDYFIDDKPVAGIPSPGTTVTVIVTGKGNYRGLIVGEYRIVSYDIAKAKVTIPVQYYTGRPIKPSYDDITVEINKIKLSKDDYEIVSYTNNINKGTAKLTIKGKGEYGGTKTINFTIKQRSLGNTIHFNLNGGSGTLNDQLIYKDTALSNYNGKKTVNGITYTFKGWSTVLNGDIVYRNKQLFTYDPKMAGRTVTLYAVWE